MQKENNSWTRVQRGTENCSEYQILGEIMLFVNREHVKFAIFSSYIDLFSFRWLEFSAAL